jgi:hypothetical protein
VGERNKAETNRREAGGEGGYRVVFSRRHE